MNTDLAATLSARGYAHVPGVLSNHDFGPLDSEFTATMNSRIEAWAERGDLDNVDGIDRSSIRRGLLDLAGTGGFDEALLGELDITLPYQPWSVIQPDSPINVGPALLALVTSSALLDVIEEIVGPDIALSPNGHARYKVPASGAGGITPWHRDAMTHARASDPVPVVTCWVPMGDVDVSSGCLVVVPGGHRTYPELDWPLTPEIVTELDGKAVPLPVRRGDIVLLDKHMPHASLPNVSRDLRWSFDLRYYPVDQPSDRPWFPSLQVRGGADGGPDVDAWRRSWELTREAFARDHRLVPGRPEHARTIAERHIESWSYDS